MIVGLNKSLNWKYELFKFILIIICYTGCVCLKENHSFVDLPSYGVASTWRS